MFSCSGKAWVRKIRSFPSIVETCLSWPFSWIRIAGVWDGSRGLENLRATQHLSTTLRYLWLLSSFSPFYLRPCSCSCSYYCPCSCSCSFPCSCSPCRNFCHIRLFSLQIVV